jgi:phosphatidylglycerophosphatase A
MAVSILATVGGIGRIKFAPGTFGSLAAILPAWALMVSYGPMGPYGMAIVVFAIGCWCSEIYVRSGRVDDPQEIVIDEVAGQTLAIAFVPEPANAIWILAAFIAFRFFDILKPWPVSLAERKCPGGYGVMADDIVAGLYAGLTLVTAQWVLAHLASGT